MRMSADLERMGDLARHIAKVARLRYPESAIPATLRGTITEMGHAADKIVAQAGSIIAGKDVAAAVALETQDDEMDALHRQVFEHLLGGHWDAGIQAAVDVTLTDATVLRSAFAQDAFGENITETTSDIAADNDAVFAINGDYYGFRDTGIVIRNGVLYRDEGVREALHRRRL